MKKLAVIACCYTLYQTLLTLPGFIRWYLYLMDKATEWI